MDSAPDDKPKAKVAWADMRVRVWTPLDDRDPCIAMIGTAPVFFEGKTPLAARRKAEEFRNEHLAKQERAKAAAEARLAGMAAAREARKAAKDAAPEGQQ